MYTTKAECGWCACLCSRVSVVCVVCAVVYACTQCAGGCGYIRFVYMRMVCGDIYIVYMCMVRVPLWDL